MLKTVDPKKAKKYFEEKLAFTLGPAELEHLMDGKEKIVVVDVRRAEDYAEGHIPGAISLPKDRWDALEGLRKDRNNIVYCYSQQCHLAATAAERFAIRGFPVMELEGGFGVWKEQGRAVEKAPGETTEARAA